MKNVPLAPACLLALGLLLLTACSFSSGSTRFGGGRDVSEQEAEQIKEQLEPGMHYDEVHALLDPVTSFYTVKEKDGGPYTGKFREKYKLRKSFITLSYEGGILRGVRITAF